MKTENRISATLATLKAASKKALVTYIVSGDPDLSITVQAMHTLVDAGADIIELGVPFSDPMAEGPVIQRGHERALEKGVSLLQTLEQVKIFREQNSHTPVVLMGYANPVARMGYEKFADLAADAGVDGLLTVDLPPEEARELDACLLKRGLHNIFLIAPTTSTARVSDICEAARGFVYYVSFRGVTGANRLDMGEIQQKLHIIKQAANTPVLVGFGIKDAASAKAIGQLSDGVVVGSALVDAMANKAGDPAGIQAVLRDLVAPMRVALDELD